MSFSYIGFMKKKTLILVALLLQLCTQLTAQDIEVVKQSAFQKEKKVKTLDYIESPADTASMTFVATLKVTGENRRADLNAIYFKMKDKARDLGANAFKYTNYEMIDSANKAILVADLYFANDSALDANTMKQEKNAVYVFGDVVPSEKTVTYKANGEKKELLGGKYAKYVNSKEGDEVKINKGGFTGASMTITWKENKSSIYVSLTGFGLGGGPVPAGQIGLSFNSGRINYIDNGLARILLQVMKEAK